MNYYVAIVLGLLLMYYNTRDNLYLYISYLYIAYIVAMYPFHTLIYGTGVEGFGSAESESESDDIEYSSSLFTSDGLLNEDVFGDVIIHENDVDSDNNLTQTGIHKCIAECDGNCVEFGVTGKGLCFPKETLSTSEES